MSISVLLDMCVPCSCWEKKMMYNCRVGRGSSNTLFTIVSNLRFGENTAHPPPVRTIGFILPTVTHPDLLLTPGLLT